MTSRAGSGSLSPRANGAGAVVTSDRRYSTAVEDHLGIVRRAVTFWAPNLRSHERDDVFQAGTVGLIIGLRKYDPAKGATIYTYVSWWINRAIREYLNDRPVVRASWSQRRRSKEPIRCQVVSIDLTNAEWKPLVTLPAPDAIPALDAKMMVRDYLDRLEPVDADILRRRYGIGCLPETLEAIGHSMHISRERIRQREVQALWRIQSVAGVARGVEPRFDGGRAAAR